MGTFGPGVSSAHDGITSGAITVTTPTGTDEAWQVPSADVTFTVIDLLNDAAPLPDLVVPGGPAALSWVTSYPTDAIGVIPPGETVGREMISVEAQLAGATTAADVQTALDNSITALATANDALRVAGQGGGGGGGPITIDGLTGTTFTLAQIHARDTRVPISIDDVNAPQVAKTGLYRDLLQIPAKADLVGGKVPTSQLPATGSQSRPLMQRPDGTYPARNTVSSDPTETIYFRQYYTQAEPPRGTDGAAAYAPDPANGIPGDLLIVGTAL